MIEIQLKHTLGEMILDIEERLPSTGITAIFGRSGSGKTSFINAVSGLINPQQGRIVVKERTIFDQQKQY